MNTGRIEDLVFDEALMKKHRFRLQDRTDRVQAPAFQQIELQGSNLFSFNQFSVYRSTPFVSARVANETALTVEMTNAWYASRQADSPLQNQNPEKVKSFKDCFEKYRKPFLLKPSEMWVTSLPEVQFCLSESAALDP